MQFALQPIHRYFERKYEQIAEWDRAKQQAARQIVPLTTDESRVVPLMVDDSRVVPLMVDDSRVVPMETTMPASYDQLERKVKGMPSGTTGLLAIPEELVPHVPEGHSYITMPDLRNVGVVSTR